MIIYNTNSTGRTSNRCLHYVPQNVLMFFLYIPYQISEALGKPLTAPCVSLTDWHPIWDGWDGKCMCLNVRSLVVCIANKAQDSFLLYLTLYSLQDGIILQATSARVGEAND